MAGSWWSRSFRAAAAAAAAVISKLYSHIKVYFLFSVSIFWSIQHPQQRAQVASLLVSRAHHTITASDGVITASDGVGGMGTAQETSLRSGCCKKWNC